MTSASASPRTNLVAPSIPFFGRLEELRIVAEVLEGDAGIVTLTGPGGIGKSRLAVQAGLAYLACGQDRCAWLLDLSACRTLDDLLDVVSSTLGLRSDARGSPADVGERISRTLVSRGEALFLLDGFDDLVQAAARNVESMASAAPGSKFLVTSRQRLGLQEELVYEIGPLSLVPAAQASGVSEARLFFLDCASRRIGNYQPAPEELPFIDAIVRELDGLPLALELAAARVSVMSPRVLLHRLQSNLAMLRRSGRGGPARHASLDAAIEGSWNALLPWERDALSQCTVFRGSFGIDAAEHVVDLSGHDGAPEVVDVLQALRDKSMVRAAQPLGGGTELRLALYNGTRAFAEARVDPEVLQAAESRHADYYLAKGEGSQGKASARGSLQARRAVLSERDNLLAIVERVLGRGPVTARCAEPALRALLLLAPGLYAQGPVRALLHAIDPVLDVTRDSGANPLLYARVLGLRGALRRQGGNRVAATRDLLQTLGMARTLFARDVEALALFELGLLMLEAAELDDARLHFESALSLFKSLGELSQEAVCLTHLAVAFVRLGQLDAAAPLLERSIALHDSLGDRYSASIARRHLGSLHLDLGRHATAGPLLLEARAAATESSDALEASLCACSLGLAAQDEGDVDAASRLVEEALSTLRELGEPQAEARALGHLGIIRAQAGKQGEAYALLRSACALLGPEPRVEEAGLFHAHLALLELGAGRESDAGESLARAREVQARTRSGWLSSVLALLEEGPPRAPNAATGGRRSVHVRVAAHCLAPEAGAANPAEAPPADDALVIGPKAAWLRLPGGATLSLEKRRPLARIVVRLAQERRQPEGKSLAWEELLAAGWPGEKVLPSAGAHRVRVAVSTLRKLGLGELIRTEENGYELAAGVPIVHLSAT